MALDLSARISLDGSGFESGLKRIEGAVSHVGETLKNLALGAIGIYGIEQAISKTIETADKLVDSANRLGIPTVKLQEMKFAAEQSSVKFEELVEFIEKLNKARIDPKKVDYFGRLGISQADLSNLQIPELIAKLSENVRTRSPQEFGPPLLKIDKSAGAVIPMLREDMAEMAAEAHRLGAIMSTETIVMLKAMRDEMTILGEVLTANLAPAIVFVEEKFLRLINVIKAIGTFLGTVAGGTSGKDWRTALDAFMHPFSVTPQRKEAVDKIKGSFTEAWDAFSLAYESGDKMIDNQIAALVAKQKMMEQIGSMPNFNEVMDEGKHHQGARPYTDDLLKVGSFLGSSNNPGHSILSVNQQQLNVLRSIDRKLDRGSESDMLPPF